MPRQFTLDCGVVDLVVRLYAAVAHLLLVAAACWGFVLASLIWNGPPLPGYPDPHDRAVFTGIMAVYYTLFGVLGFLAELRMERLMYSVLRPFAFVNGNVGRGCFYIYIGTVFLYLPWDDARPWISRVAGSLEIAAGGLEILVALLGGIGGYAVANVPSRGAAPGAASGAARSGGGGGRRGAQPGGAAVIAWGQPETENGQPAAAEGDAEAGEAAHVDSSGSHGGFKASAETPRGAGTAPLARGSDAGAGGGGGGGGEAVVTKNPFLNAGAPPAVI